MGCGANEMPIFGKAKHFKKYNWRIEVNYKFFTMSNAYPGLEMLN